MRIPSYRTTKRLALALGVVGLAGCQSSGPETDGELGTVAEAEHAVANDPLPNTRFDVVDLGNNIQMYLLVTNGMAFRLNCPAGDARDNMVAGAGFDANQVGRQPFLHLTDTEIVDLASVGVPERVESPTPDSFRALPCNNPSQAAFNVIDFSAAQDGSDKRYFVALNVVDPVSSTLGSEKDAAGRFILRNVGCGELLLAMGYPLRDAIPIDHRQVYQPPPAVSDGIYVTSDPYDINCHTGHTPATFIPSITPSVDPAQPLIKKAGDTWQVVFTPFALPVDAALVLTTNGCGFAQPQNLSISKWTVTGAIPSPFTSACSLTFTGQSGTIKTAPVSIQFAPPPSANAGPDSIFIAGVHGSKTISVAAAAADGSSFNISNASVGDVFAAAAESGGAEKLAGDFNKDGMTDVALVGAPGTVGQPFNVGLPVAFATAGGAWNPVSNTTTAITQFAKSAAAAGVQRLVGDFDGDGKADIALVGGGGPTTIPVAFSDFATDGSGTWTINNGNTDTTFGPLAASARARLVGDFNGDGKSDIALVPQASWTTMPVALSNGRGGWTFVNPPIDAAFAAQISAPSAEVFVGDFKKDGRSDIAFVSTSTIRFAASGGTTTTVTWTAMGDVAAPGALGFGTLSGAPGASRLVGDFNGDGASDIALTGAVGWNGLHFALSNNDGTWTFLNPGALQFATEASSPKAVPVVGDFNRDGVSDLALTGVPGWSFIPVATSSKNGAVTAKDWGLTDSGFGAWATAATLGEAATLAGYVGNVRSGGTVDPQPRRVKKNDDVLMHGELINDAITVGAMPIGRSRRDGTWDVESGSLPPLPSGARAVDPVGHRCGGTTKNPRLCHSVLGTDFGWLAARGGQSYVGDFDGDGRSDVMLAPSFTWLTSMQSTIPVAFGLPGGIWKISPNTTTTIASASLANSTRITGDFDGDGKTDFMVAGGQWVQNGTVAATSVSIAFSNGDGTWRTPLAAPLPSDFSAQRGVSAYSGDYDGDGKTDVALAGPVSLGEAPLTTIPVAFSNGDGSWSTADNFASSCTQFLKYAARGVHQTDLTSNGELVTGDFNGDGKTDFAVTGSKDMTSIPIAFSVGNGNFVCTYGDVGTFGNDTAASTAYAGDFDGDGRTDVAFITVNAGPTIPIAFANGDGTWRITKGDASAFFAIWNATYPFVGDFNDDGRADFALRPPGGSSSTTMMVAFANGDGTWTITSGATTTDFMNGGEAAVAHAP